ncbi:MAG: hypothetical protein CSA68_09685 [Rhodobacterales bacterium]|nr:MAG: hypothetical protein CSA68_09685 [Rhodobacterales bacterium]
MAKRNNTAIIISLVLAVAAPAVFSLTMHYFTQNPTWLPLARTENDEEIYNGAIIVNRIYAEVTWPTRRKRNFTKKDLNRVIKKAFRVHNAPVIILFRDVDKNENVQIVYKIGANELGPVTVLRAADGIKGAVAAYRMYQMLRPRA